MKRNVIVVCLWHLVKPLFLSIKNIPYFIVVVSCSLSNTVVLRTSCRHNQYLNQNVHAIITQKKFKIKQHNKGCFLSESNYMCENMYVLSRKLLSLQICYPLHKRTLFQIILYFFYRIISLVFKNLHEKLLYGQNICLPTFKRNSK